MSGTRIESLIAHMVATFPTGATMAGHVVQVIDGPGTLDIRNNVLYLGHSVVTPTYSAAGTQQWAAVGRIPPSRKEDLELNCSLRVGMGGTRDMTTCRTRAVAIFEAMAETLRGSVAAFSGNGLFTQIQLARYRIYQEFTNDGTSVTLEFAITATARI